MAIQKAEGIVLRRRSQGETSKIITFYTREFGKLSLMAKGSRGIHSKYLGTLETYNHLSIVFYQKDQRQLQYLSQASIVRSFATFSTQLAKFSLASIPCEVVEKAEIDNHPHPQLYHLLLDTLTAIDEHHSGLRNIVRAFILQYAVHSGFEPELDRCHHCSRPDPADLNFFFLTDGYYICGRCTSGDVQSRRISGYGVQLLRWLIKCPVGSAVDAQVSAAIGNELDLLLFDYLKTHFESLTVIHSYDQLLKLSAEFAPNKSNPQ